jgi:hypothetical protein
MLLLPWIAGVITSGFRWVDVPLLVAWLSAYLFSYYGLVAVKTRRLARVRTQVALYGGIAVVTGGLTLALRPWLLWYGLAYVPLFAVNVWYARRRNDRALLNDLASVLQACVMVFVVAGVAGAGLRGAVVPFAVVVLYFTGTVLYVKTMIRERGDAWFYRASVGYHVAAFVASLWLGPLPAVLFALLLVRAWALPKRKLTALRIGVFEIVASVLVLVAAAVQL